MQAECAVPAIAAGAIGVLEVNPPSPGSLRRGRIRAQIASNPATPVPASGSAERRVKWLMRAAGAETTCPECGNHPAGPGKTKFAGERKSRPTRGTAENPILQIAAYGPTHGGKDASPEAGQKRQCHRNLPSGQAIAGWTGTPSLARTGDSGEPAKNHADRIPGGGYEIRIREIAHWGSRSGTLVDAPIILEAFGLSESDIAPEYLKPDPTAERMRDGTMDAFFFVGSYPAGGPAERASQHDVTLVPITGPEVGKLREAYIFFAAGTVPAGTRRTGGRCGDISVGAQLVTGTDLNEEPDYGIAKAICNETTQKLFAADHAKGGTIALDNATRGAGIPFHPGAERFCEAGKHD